MERYGPKKEDGCTQGERSTRDSEEVQCEEETGPFPIPSNKYTNPGIKDQLRTLYGTLEEFYLISHRIQNPEWNSRFTDTNQNP